LTEHAVVLTCGVSAACSIMQSLWGGFLHVRECRVRETVCDDGSGSKASGRCYDLILPFLSFPTRWILKNVMFWHSPN
jgi:hypothetical protein